MSLTVFIYMKIVKVCWAVELILMFYHIRHIDEG